jgi:hypothetical protein
MRQLKTFLTGVAGVLTGMIISSIIRDEEIVWDTTDILIGLAVLVLLFRLGLQLYKNRGIL